MDNDSFSGVSCGDEFPRRDGRFPQWSNQETRDLIEIRAQLDWEFTKGKGKKNLWEMVANRLGEKGYRRTHEQCRGKWENLVKKYKGQESSDLNNGSKCPFFDDLLAFFTSRVNKMPQEEYGKDEETFTDQTETLRVAPKSKVTRQKRQKTGHSNTNVNHQDHILDSLQEMVRNFSEQQQMIDTQWMDSMERRAQEKERFEQEWREKMEKLERDRMAMERSWRVREEQRRTREESRAEKRDALLTTILNKLIRDENL